jgi:alginate O-acetyltransferase complex protein AlgI
MGIHLPENFNQPYMKSNLTQFWNSWHITLAQWFRAYFFNPLTRFLRSRPEDFPVWLIIMVTQTSTMLLIGLWHGLTWNFAIWGLWHGIGLFVHNRWSTIRLPYSSTLTNSSWGPRLLSLSSTVFTFHYVVLGWVWFAISSPDISIRFLRTLFAGG